MSRRRRRLLLAVGSYEAFRLVELEGGEYNIQLEGGEGVVLQEGSPAGEPVE